MSEEKIKARASLFIRKAPAEVYEAFIQPEILNKFWLAKASGPLEVDKRVSWEFMVKGAKVDATATNLENGKLISVDWSDDTKVNWTFEPFHEGTVVKVENFGFSGTKAEIIETALESTQGFTLVLAALKSYLEKGSAMGITSDKAFLIEETMRL